MPALSRKKALDLWNQSIDTVTNGQLWSAGLLVLSSAALGGIAVALWNRQALAKMRAGEDAGEVPVSHSKSKPFQDE